MASKNPKECWSCVRQQTIAVQPELYLADPYRKDKDGNDAGEDPAKIWGEFSRVKFTIIGKDKKFATSSISIKKQDPFKGIEARSRFAFEENERRSLSGAAAQAGGQTQTSSAYTLAFKMGNLKGKTPAQILLENGDKGREILNQQYAFLAKNAAKYAENKLMMQAISEAADLYKKGELKAENAAPAPAATYEIFSQLHGNIHKQHESRKGYYHCHEIKIGWQFGMNYPVSVEISNYYAPIEQDSVGRINVQRDKKLQDDTFVRCEFKLTGDEWLDCLEDIDTRKNVFVTAHAKDIENNIQKCDADNRRNATS